MVACQDNLDVALHGGGEEEKRRNLYPASHTSEDAAAVALHGDGGYPTRASFVSRHDVMVISLDREMYPL